MSRGMRKATRTQRSVLEDWYSPAGVPGTCGVRTPRRVCRYMQMCARDLDLLTVAKEASACTGLDFERVRRWFYRAISQRRKSETNPRCGSRGRNRMLSGSQTSRALPTGQPLSDHPQVQPDLSALKACGPIGLPAEREANVRNQNSDDIDAEPCALAGLRAAWNMQIGMQGKRNLWNHNSHAIDAELDPAASVMRNEVQGEPNSWNHDWHDTDAELEVYMKQLKDMCHGRPRMHLHPQTSVISAPASAAASRCSTRPSSPLPSDIEYCPCCLFSDITDHTSSSSAAENAWSSALDEVFCAALDAYQSARI